MRCRTGKTRARPSHQEGGVHSQTAETWSSTRTLPQQYESNSPRWTRIQDCEVQLPASPEPHSTARMAPLPAWGKWFPGFVAVFARGNQGRQLADGLFFSAAACCSPQRCPAMAKQLNLRVSLPCLTPADLTALSPETPLINSLCSLRGWIRVLGAQLTILPKRQGAKTPCTP